LTHQSQIAALGNSVHSSYNHEQQKIYFIHRTKTVNYHNADAEDIPFIFRKLKET